MAAVHAAPIQACRLQVRRRRHGWAFQAVWAGIGASCALAVLGWGLWWTMAHPMLDGAGVSWAAWAWLGSAVLAFGLDACWGEWPSRWHPVAWLGQAAQRWQGAWQRQPSAAVSRVAGRRAWWLSWGGLMVAVTGLQGAGWAALCLWPGATGAALAAVLWALLLKPGMAGRMLLTEVQAVSDALARSVEKVTLELTGEKPWHVEGQEGGQWILLDYVDVVVHIFHKDRRAFYDLEQLWSDAVRNTYENVA